jgi:hypothetical protein
MREKHKDVTRGTQMARPRRARKEDLCYYGGMLAGLTSERVW